MTRVRFTLAALIVTTVLGAGLLTQALSWPARPATGITVAVASVLTASSAALAVRIVLVLDRLATERRPIPVPFDDRSRPPT